MGLIGNSILAGDVPVSLTVEIGLSLHLWPAKERQSDLMLTTGQMKENADTNIMPPVCLSGMTQDYLYRFSVTLMLEKRYWKSGR